MIHDTVHTEEIDAVMRSGGADQFITQAILKVGMGVGVGVR